MAEFAQTHLVRSSSGGVWYLGPNSTNETSTDVILNLKDGQLRTHRVVLAAGCETFKRCLKECYPHLVEEDSSSVVILPDFTVSDAAQLLDTLYGKNEELAFGGSVGELAKAVGLRWQSESEMRTERLKDLCLRIAPVVKIEVNEGAEMLAATIKCEVNGEDIDMNVDNTCSDDEEMEDLCTDPDYDYVMEQEGMNLMFLQLAMLVLLKGEGMVGSWDRID